MVHHYISRASKWCAITWLPWRKGRGSRSEDARRTAAETVGELPHKETDSLLPAIEETEGFYGADGLFRFQADGMIERGLAIYEMRSRGFFEIEPAPQTFEPEAF